MTATATGAREQAWREWGGLDRCASWEPPVVARGTARAVVVAPHPDDETLAVGGTMQRLATAGWDLTLVAVTDGEASHPRWPGGSRALASTRREELASALRALGLAKVDVRHLGLPDSDVAAHRDVLDAVLDDLLTGAALVLAPHPADGHADHDVVGAAAVGAGVRRGVPVAAFGVWLWAWSSPGEARYPWMRAVRVTLDDARLERKERALEAYGSQLLPSGGEDVVVPPDVVEHHRRPFELLFAMNGPLP